jgi:3-phenylpropionate/cinnamic acid dioxygenase small subunit
MNAQTELFLRVSQFLNAEADMLDHREYQSWLSLWSESGLYIVPTDPQEQDFENALNIAYDDQQMRHLRIARLESGEAVSTQGALPTSRTVSAIRIQSVETNDAGRTLINVRCSYCLFENKSGDLRPYPATAEFILDDSGDELKLQQKVVRLLRGNQYVATVAYIF